MKGKCEMCGQWGNLEKHHVFPGAFRKKSEKYGAVAYLCHTCHNEPPNGVHFNRFMRLTLQEQTQRKLMEIYGWNIERFIEIFGKNYL